MKTKLFYQKEEPSILTCQGHVRHFHYYETQLPSNKQQADIENMHL